MRRLLDARAEVDVKDSSGRTPLHLALSAENDKDEDSLQFGSGVRVHGLKSRPERNGKLRNHQTFLGVKWAVASSCRRRTSRGCTSEI